MTLIRQSGSRYNRFHPQYLIFRRVRTLADYAYELDRTELLDFVSRFGDKVQLFDLYGAVQADFAPLWYDDAHVELSPVGSLTTALMVQRLLQSEALHTLRSELDG